jgi:hypothetical protein
MEAGRRRLDGGCEEEAEGGEWEEEAVKRLGGGHWGRKLGEEAGSKRLGRGVWEEESGRRSLGGGGWEEEAGHHAQQHRPGPRSCRSPAW